jgi:hypothetical protein
MGMFINSFVYLMTGPQPLPKLDLHRLRYSHSSFNFQCPLVSLRPSSSCLHLLSCISVTSVLPFTFYSITCFRRKFPVRLFFFFLWYSSPPWLSATLLHFSHDRFNWSSPSFSGRNFQVFLIYFPNFAILSTVQNHNSNVQLYWGLP